MTRKAEVKLRLWSRRGTRIERTVEVDLVENAAGRVFVDYDDEGFVRVLVEVTDLGAARPFLEDTRLVLRADHAAPELRGKVTPKGRDAPLDGALFVEGRPFLRELYDGAIALDIRLDAARQAIWDQERDRDAPPAEG